MTGAGSVPSSTTRSAAGRLAGSLGGGAGKSCRHAIITTTNNATAASILSAVSRSITDSLATDRVLTHRFPARFRRTWTGPAPARRKIEAASPERLAASDAANG